MMFPFDLPNQTAGYMLLLVVTMVPHIVFVGYLLVGTAWVLVDSKSDISSQLAPTLPVALSGAITAAIAPLLFLQILYREEHYTANLLLSHRWMVMLPVLIVGFYSLYAIRIRAVAVRPALRRLTICVALASFLFTGFSWSENHLLAVAGQNQHTSFYVSKDLFYTSPALFSRIATFICGTLPVGAIGIAWITRDSMSQVRMRRLALIAVLGIVGCSGFGAAYRSISPMVEVAFSTASTLPWLMLSCVGALSLALFWLLSVRRNSMSSLALKIGLALTVVTTFGGTMLRETIRVTTLGESRMAELAKHHAHSAHAPGLVAFLICAVVIVVGVATVVRTIRQSQTT